MDEDKLTTSHSLKMLTVTQFWTQEKSFTRRTTLTSILWTQNPFFLPQNKISQQVFNMPFKVEEIMTVFCFRWTIPLDMFLSFVILYIFFGNSTVCVILEEGRLHPVWLHLFYCSSLKYMCLKLVTIVTRLLGIMPPSYCQHLYGTFLHYTILQYTTQL